ncbi:MAG: GDP-mannose 4,6-dehydratase [Chitinophagales bacterium]|nr:GDP-mannose 4,6-dehydratase [Chitinophagales bacterium]MDW8427894.1 GDP-mannose 4,6-dehydratase [Chitinophagales bacterium]
MNEGAVVWITGAAGLVGSHLIEALHQHVPPHRLIGTWHRPTVDLDDILPLCTAEPLDVTDGEAVAASLNRHRPEVIYHLAAQSYPTVSWEQPVETMNVNINGTVHVFEAIRRIRQADRSYDPMVVVACSSAEYGASLTPEHVPVREDAPLLPLHPYGVSKVGQDLLAFQYWKNFGIRCVRVRIFNTTGPRKKNDVVSDFVQRAFAISRGEQEVFRVGNLSTRRAITDVRDLVAALISLAQKGEPGEVYNVSGDRVYLIADLIPLVERAAGVKLNVVEDPALRRPSDEPVIVGDSSKLKACTGWQQHFTLEQTIQDMFAYLQKKAAIHMLR